MAISGSDMTGIGTAVHGIFDEISEVLEVFNRPIYTQTIVEKKKKKETTTTYVVSKLDIILAGGVAYAGLIKAGVVPAPKLPEFDLGGIQTNILDWIAELVKDMFKPPDFSGLFDFSFDLPFNLDFDLPFDLDFDIPIDFDIGSWLKDRYDAGDFLPSGDDYDPYQPDPTPPM